MKPVNIQTVDARIEHLENRAGLSLAEEFELQCLRKLFDLLTGPGERNHVRAEHASWSQEAFGDVGPVGPLKHLSIEALEAAAAPGDLSEWADMQFLLWDAQRRAGITDEQMTQAMIDKLAVNKARTWQEPKDGEPRLHVKEQPAPVAHDSGPSLSAMMRALDAFYADDDVPERAMLAAFKILLADVRKQALPVETLAKALENAPPAPHDNQGRKQPATDNTAQQFEALATSAPSTPTFTAEELKSFGREMWFDGWRTSPHTPNPNYDCNQALMGTDVAERLTTSAGSGKP